jgi:hypothetical protein
MREQEWSCQFGKNPDFKPEQGEGRYLLQIRRDARSEATFHLSDSSPQCPHCMSGSMFARRIGRRVNSRVIVDVINQGVCMSETQATSQVATDQAAVAAIVAQQTTDQAALAAAETVVSTDQATVTADAATLAVDQAQLTADTAVAAAASAPTVLSVLTELETSATADSTVSAAILALIQQALTLAQVPAEASASTASAPAADPVSA